MLKLQGKKQTNLTPTLRDGSDNHEMKKNKKEEITEGLIGKSSSLCNIVLYPSVKQGDQSPLYLSGFLVLFSP